MFWVVVGLIDDLEICVEIFWDTFGLIDVLQDLSMCFWISLV